LPEAPSLNRNLARLAARVRQVARERGHGFIDLLWGAPDHPPLTSDGFHLGPRGVRQVSALIAGLAGFEPQRWRVSLDAAARRTTADVTGTSLSEVTANPRGLEFRAIDSGLPGALAPDRVLRVTGLADGQYQLLIDGVPVA